MFKALRLLSGPWWKLLEDFVMSSFWLPLCFQYLRLLAFNSTAESCCTSARKTTVQLLSFIMNSQSFSIFSQFSVFYLMFKDWWKENSTELHEQACCISSVFYCVISQLRSNQYWSESTLLKYEACALTESALLWIYDNFKQ